HAAGDLRHRADRTGRHQHAHAAEAATGDCRTDVRVLVVHVGERTELGEFQFAFMREREDGGLADHEVAFHAQAPQLAKGLDAVDETRGARDADDETVRSRARIHVDSPLLSGPPLYWPLPDKSRSRAPSHAAVYPHRRPSGLRHPRAAGKGIPDHWSG